MPFPSKGPAWIQNALISAGVNNAPDFEFTNEYDIHKQYENIRGLFFKGLAYHGKTTKVFCWYGVPETLKQGEKAPAVVLVHGGTGTVFPQWVKKWTDRGYIAISVALEGQIPGPKTDDSPIDGGHPRHECSGPYRIGFFFDIIDQKLEDQWFYHAVANVMLANSLLRSFPEIETTKIGITGISWGGILTNVITGIDDRFAFAIPVYGCGYLHETPFFSERLKQHTAQSKKYYLENWEPSLYAPLQKGPTLFINGTNDRFFPMNSFTKTYKSSGAEKYLHIEHEMHHGHMPGWDAEEIYQFADFVVKNGKTPVKLTNAEEGNQVVFDGEIIEAVAYYTSDTVDWSGEAYKWIKLETKISDKTIITNLPKGAEYYFVNGTTPDKMMYSSEMLKQRNDGSKNH